MTCGASMSGPSEVNVADDAPSLQEFLGDALGVHGLHQVVGRTDGEGFDRMLVIRGDEDDLRATRESGQHTGEIHAIEARHLHIAKDRVDDMVFQNSQGKGATAGEMDLADPSVLAEQVRQFLASGSLVIDDEDVQRRAHSPNLSNVHRGRQNAPGQPTNFVERRARTWAPESSPSSPSSVRSPRPTRRKRFPRSRR